MGIPCGKRSLTFIWGIFECLFFSGIINGWISMEYILKQDQYFLDRCNISFLQTNDVIQNDGFDLDKSIQNSAHHGKKIKCVYVRVKLQDLPKQVPTVSPVPPVPTTGLTSVGNDPDEPLVESMTEGDWAGVSCEAREDQLERIMTLVLVIRNILMLPLGVFLDKYGTSRTRLLAIMCLAFGSLMMLFSSSAFPWLILPALTLLGVSGLLVLITDLQIANLFGGRRYTAMCSIVGAYMSGGVVVILMQLTYNTGVNLQTSFMFITIGVVPVLISTIVLLPKSRIPWPLPADYGKSKHGGFTKEEAYIKTRPWQRRISAGAKCRRDTPPLTPVLGSSLYVCAVIWFCILQLKSFMFEMNIKRMLRRTENNNDKVNSSLMVYSMLTLLSLPISPIIGLVMDWQRSAVRDVKTAQMLNIVRAIILVLLLSVASGCLVLVSLYHLQILTFILQIIEKVAVLAVLFAFLTHMHFPTEHFGKCVGLVFAFSGLVLLLQFPLKVLLLRVLQSDPFYVNVSLLVLVLVTAAHPINAWYQCKMGHVQDQSPPEKQRQTVTIMLMEKKRDEEEVPEKHTQEVTFKTGLQVTDL